MEWQKRTADARNPDGEPFRRCSYCGSIHPEDLLAVVEAGARLGGSDWKYGWPHKFYVENIPNPNSARRVEIGGRSYFDETKGERVFEPHYGEEGNYHAKWYNEHLLDVGYDDEAWQRLVAALEHYAGITFRLVDGKLQYAAPMRGYQR
jgi:hypothetical protein